MSGRILVTGASGGLGRQVVEFLLERLPAGRVAALTRKPESLADLTGRGVSVRPGTTSTRPALSGPSRAWRSCC